MKKKPTQQRSQAMVNKLINATSQAITLYGIDGLTTVKVADLAEVSIGSLYQYFANKQELMAALIEHNTLLIIQDLRQILLNNPKASLEEILTKSINHGFYLFRQEDRVCFEIVKNWLSLPVPEAIDIIYTASTQLGQHFFLQHANDYSLEDLHIKSFIIINSTLFTMIRYMNNDNLLLSEQDLTNGLTKMIMGYINSTNQ